MEISELGEFGLIRRLAKTIQPTNAETIQGIGDDCAILNCPDGTDQLVTTDMLMEGIHFDLTYMPMHTLGYKSAQVNFSDVYAMGGMPRQITVSIAVSGRLSVEDLEQFYAGLALACQEHQVDIVGGDTTTSVTGLAISITCIGTVPHGQAIRRSTARPTDLICVSGDLGAAYMGLQLLEREKEVYYGQLRDLQERLRQAQSQEGHQQQQEHIAQQIRQLDFQPDFAGREYLLQRQMQPQARRDIILTLQQHHLRPTSMIDISDGLSSELLHICHLSHVGCRVYEERIPLDYQTAAMAEQLNLNVTTCALNGGEDYELLFTLPISDHEALRQIPSIHVIGHITQPELGAALITRDGNEFELKAQGWQPFADDWQD